MNLAALFGDDEHTASDGAYRRALAARKWLFGAAFIAWAVASGAFTPKPFGILVGDLTLDLAAWRAAAWYGLLYAFGVYCFVLIQLRSTYMGILRERLTAKTLERMEAVRADWQAAREDYAVEKRKRPRGPEQEKLHLERLRHLTRRMAVIEKRLGNVEDTFSADRTYVAAEIAMDAARLGLPFLAGVFSLATWF